MIKDSLAKTIAGEITLSENPAKTLRKWREIFGVNQKKLAQHVGVSASVISDYESGRRKNPGSSYIKKTVESLIELDLESGGEFAQTLKKEDPESAILGIQEFLEPLPVKKLIKAVEGKTVSGREHEKRLIWGYTIIDSIKAILKLSSIGFAKIYGSTTERALVFTKVRTGRSPMIALKVTGPKPAAVILHGLSPSRVDKLAVKIAEVAEIPLIVSTLKREEDLIKRLSELRIK